MTIQTNHHPILVIIRGVPGSGKTYLTNELQKTIGTDGVAVLDPDSIDQDTAEYSDFSQSLSAEGIDLKFHLYRYSRAKAHQAIIDNKIIIWNQPFMDFDSLEKTIVNLQTYATDNNTTLPIVIVEVEVDAKTAKTRIDERKQQGGHGPSDNTLEARFFNRYESFGSKGYDTVTINGTDPVEQSVAVVTRLLERN